MDQDICLGILDKEYVPGDTITLRIRDRVITSPDLIVDPDLTPEDLLEGVGIE